jgi:hypothetical protein
MDAEELVRSKERAAPMVAELGDVLETRRQRLGRTRSPIEAVKSHVRVYIAPWFGDFGVDEHDEGKVEAFVAWLGRNGCSPNGGLITPPERPDRGHDAGHDRGR